jgi:Fic family protein
MPNTTPSAELDALFAVIAAEPEGLGLAAIAKRLVGTSLERRTLQRRLALLVAQKRIERLGQKRGSRYRLPLVLSRGESLPLPMQAEAATAPIWYDLSPRTDAPLHGYEVRESTPSAATSGWVVSAAGAQIQRYVNQPRHMRRPVGYQTAFLDAYRVNETAYLPHALRDELRSMGSAPLKAAQNQPAPAGTFAKDILNRLLIDLSWASSQLEGNTYSRLDTERLIEHGQAAEGKDAFETQMILNHKQAIEYLVLAPENAQVTSTTLITLHAFLSDGLMRDPAAVGRLRRRPVEISASVYLPLALPQRVEDVFGQVVRTAAQIEDPFEQAFFLMVHLPYLQPFEDVNKRVSRLAANIPLIRHNLCPLSFIDVSQTMYVQATLGVYELNQVDLLRDVFVRAYERSCQQYAAIQQSLVPPDAFRLRHRLPLAQTVAAIVRGGLQPTPEVVQSLVPAAVPSSEAAAFTALVVAEFASLHSGNAIRFGLRPLEFETWRHTQGRA